MCKATMGQNSFSLAWHWSYGPSCPMAQSIVILAGTTPMFHHSFSHMFDHLGHICINLHWPFPSKGTSGPKAPHNISGPPDPFTVGDLVRGAPAIRAPTTNPLLKLLRYFPLSSWYKIKINWAFSAFWNMPQSMMQWTYVEALEFTMFLHSFIKGISFPSIKMQTGNMLLYFLLWMNWWVTQCASIFQCVLSGQKQIFCKQF